MSQLENLGSTAFSRLRVLQRIEKIALAQNVTELSFRFGITMGYLNAAAELRSLGKGDWEELVLSAESAYDNHPLASVSSTSLT